jgi:hypothetical protein
MNNQQQEITKSTNKASTKFNKVFFYLKGLSGEIDMTESGVDG